MALNEPKSPGPAEALEALLQECVRLDASDLHLAPGMAPFYRIHGDLLPHETYAPLDREEVDALCGELLRWSGDEGLKKTGSQDGALTAVGATRFRFNVYRRLGGMSAAIRRLEEKFRTLGELGLPESIYQFCDLPDGIVVVAGPTGAGKSTTLAALIDRINRSRRTHIVTIEDPIEYIHVPDLSLVDQRQVGSDTSSFNDALVASLREDPDVILVGEVRDLNTIRTAIRAAETGHLVFTTVHAGDCVGTIERLVSVFPADEQAGIRQQLSLVLRAIVTQHLLPRDGAVAAEEGLKAGSRGRVVASELLIANPAIAHLVSSGRSTHIYTAMEGGGRAGMRTLEQDLARLWVEGHVSEATAVSASRNPQIVRDRASMMARRGAGARS
ncbi:MAG TPA: PilT/PilU family type 4a pilus ATPase [Planctomycetota bacterium]|nr:PilT/PilU family type 4a pilus ATPase [Planctomycetota bacterium]